MGTSKQGRAPWRIAQELGLMVSIVARDGEKHPPPSSQPLPVQSGFPTCGVCAVQRAKWPGLLGPRSALKKWSQSTKLRAYCQ